MTTSIGSSTTNGAASGTAVTVSAPSGIVAGTDAVVVDIHHNGANSACTVSDNNGSTGFTYHSRIDQTSSGSVIERWFRRIQSGDPSTYAFTLSSSQRWVAVATVIHDPDPTNLFDVSSNGAAAGFSSTVNAPSLTSVTDHSFSLLAAGIDNSTGTFSSTPSGYSSIQAVTTNQPLYVVYKAISPAGATGAQTFTAPNSSYSLSALASIIRYYAGGVTGPTINTQPTNKTAYAGSTATFTVSATASAGSLSYQWKADSGSGFTNVGTNSSSYTTGTLSTSDNGTQIKVAVTDSNGTTTSATVTLTVRNNTDITLVGVTNTQSGAGTTVTLNVMDGVVDGDLMFALLESDGASAAAFTCSGWTELHSFNQTVDSGYTTLLYRVASSEPASYNFVSSGAAGVQGCMVAYYNVDSSPFDAHAGTYATVTPASNTFTVTAPSVTTTTANGKLVWFGTSDSTTTNSITNIVVPSGYTQRVTGAQDSSGWNAMTVGDKALTTAGTQSSAAATWHQTVSGNIGTTGIHVALKLNAGGGAAPTITDVDTDEVLTNDQTGWTVTGTNYNGSTTLTFIQGSVSVGQTINSFTSTTLNCDIVFDTGGASLKNGSATAEVSDGTNTADLAITIDVPSGHQYVDIVTPNSNSSYTFDASPAVATGDQIEIKNISAGTITQNDDGTVVVTTSCTCDARRWDATDQTWSGWATQTFNVSGAVLESNAAAVASAAGALSTAIRLAANAMDSASASGALSTAIKLAVNAIAQANASGALSTAITLMGSASDAAAASGALTTQIKLAGAAISNVLASGSLDAGSLLAASAQAVATASGSLTTSIDLLGDAAAQAFASGSLNSNAAALAGAAQSIATAIGTLTTGLNLAGNAQAMAAAHGALTTSIQLFGDAYSAATAAGTLAGILGIRADRCINVPFISNRRLAVKSASRTIKLH